MPAEDLAKALAARFLAEGNYDAPAISLHIAPAAGVAALDDYFEPDAGFAGLAVQSVGYTEGADTERVVIYVTRGSKKALRELPAEIDGVEIEADVMGKLRAAPASLGTSNLYIRGNRIACGSSCAPGGAKYAGTFGAIVRQGPNLLALSNNHVLGDCNHTTVGMPILSPAPGDARAGRRAPQEIARHHKIIELRSGDPGLVPVNRLDVATAIITEQNTITSWQGDNTDGFDTPTATTAPVSGMRVKKFGRTTGFTTGIVHAFVPTPWTLPYKSDHFTARVWFTDTWTVRAPDGELFALGGDSGSLVVTEDSQAAVGLLFAANTRGDYGIILPIDDVLADIGNLRLVSRHGI